MKEVKQANKQIENANKQINKLCGERDRLTDVVRIIGDFIDHEQNMYPIQLPNFWKPI